MSRIWESRKPLPTPRCYATAIPYTGSLPMLKGESASVIILIGGCDRKGTPVNTVNMYLPDKDFWFPLKNMEVPRASPICAILNEHYIISLGGVGNDPPQAPSNAIEVYDIHKNRWYNLPGMTEPLMGMASLLKDNRLLIFGGMRQ